MKNLILILAVSVLLVSCGNQDITFNEKDSVPYSVSVKLEKTLNDIPDSVNVDGLYYVDVIGSQMYCFELVDRSFIPAYSVDLEVDSGIGLIFGLVMGFLIGALIFIE